MSRDYSKQISPLDSSVVWLSSLGYHFSIILFFIILVVVVFALAGFPYEETIEFLVSQPVLILLYIVTFFSAILAPMTGWKSIKEIISIEDEDLFRKDLNVLLMGSKLKRTRYHITGVVDNLITLKDRAWPGSKMQIFEVNILIENKQAIIIGPKMIVKNIISFYSKLAKDK